MFDRDKLTSQLVYEEGKRYFVYIDSTGHASIGVGRNLSADGLSEAEVMMLLNNDIDVVTAALNREMAWWQKLDDVRQLVIVDMAFNLGIEKLLGFTHFLAALRAGQWQEAVIQMQDSLWAKQVGARATRLEAMILSGQ